MNDADVAVVGGGITGLAAAVECARAGRRVLLLESAAELGGRARTTSLGGYHLNFGPRALYKGGALRALWRLGVRPHGGGPSPALALADGELVRGFTDIGGLLATPLLGRRDRASVLALLSTARNDRRLAGRSAIDWLHGRLPGARARDVVLALIRLATYVAAPGTVSADAVAAHLGLARWGVLYIDGGWQSVAGELAAAARHHGARVRTGSRVTGLVPGPRQVTVMLREGELTARAVVLAGLTPGEVRRLLPGLAGQAGLLGQTGPALHASCLDVALSRLPVPSRPFVLGMDSPVYLSCHSATARLAPDGGAVLHALRYHGHGDQPAAECRAELTALLDVTQPGWRELVVHQRFLPKMMVCAALPEPATDGLAGRTACGTAGADGVFLAGDWVGRRGLLAEASLASAREAAGAAVRHTG